MCDFTPGSSWRVTYVHTRLPVPKPRRLRKCTVISQFPSEHFAFIRLVQVDILIPSLFTCSVERYDPETNLWEMVSPMADKRINFGVGVLNGFIYVVGGHNGTMHLSSVERFDPHRDVWTSVTPMDMARTGKLILSACLGEN